jgi:calcium-dependent protein kinase
MKKKTFSENEAAHLMLQIFSAVSYCHLRKIVHRDLKPENLMLECVEPKNGKYDVKVIDFGVSCRFEKEKDLTLAIGTTYYVAPEVIQKSYNEKCDVWSCGVILYILLCGYPPFYGKNSQEIYKKICRANVNMSSKSLFLFLIGD